MVYLTNDELADLLNDIKINVERLEKRIYKLESKHPLYLAVRCYFLKKIRQSQNLLDWMRHPFLKYKYYHWPSFLNKHFKNDVCMDEYECTTSPNRFFVKGKKYSRVQIYNTYFTKGRSK